MTANELGIILRKMCDSPSEKKTAMILLFGIIYGQQIQSSNANIIDVLKAAGMENTLSYRTEISKGMNLAKYVQLKPEYDGKF